MKQHFQAIIVGAGPGGALLAYLLAKYGIKVLLVERQHDFEREFRGEGLSPSGQAMFKEAGLWDEFDKLPHTEFEQLELYYKRKIFTKLKLDWKDWEYKPRFVSQPAMLEMLIEQAQRFESFTFIRGGRVTKPIMHQQRVIGVEVHHDEQTEEYHSDYVFAADGRFSQLRKMVGLDIPKKPQSFDIIWAKVAKPEFDEMRDVTVRGYFGHGQLGLCIPSYDQKLQIGWVIKKGSYKKFREMGIEGWMEEMSKHVDPEMGAHLRAHRQKTIHPFLLDVVCDYYPDWSAPGILLIGDAAHPMSPVGAQGINIALRDSVVAANHFIPLFKGNASEKELDLAGALFQEKRAPEVQTIQKYQARPPMIFLSKGPLIDGVAWVIRNLMRIGWLRRLTQREAPQKNPFISGVTDVKLNQDL